VAALPADTYRVLYADPPWQYNDSRATGDHRETTAALTHYPTMCVADLCALNLRSLAQPDSVLLMWATFPLLPDALRVVEAWGFKYKTAFVWSKGRGTFGHYHTADAELLMVATRGSCVPDADTREAQVQSVVRDGRHSEKPEHFRALVDRLYPIGPRIELFARGQAASGWHTWGNEADD
jgi:N6-adenosine-specific RNA methylase IME4